MKSMKETKENAVSPVVGVMLMLVVTIIIAAVVAAFAGGLAGDTQAATNSIIKLDGNPEMASVDYSGFYPGPYTFVGYNTDLTPYPNYAPYNMTFVHKGGDALNVKDLKLSITYEGATFSSAFSFYPNVKIDGKDIATKKTWSAGEKLSITLGEDEIKDLHGDLLFGITQQDTSYSGGEVTWALKDKSDYVFASGSFMV